MSRTYKDSKKAGSRRRERHISVRAVPKDQPDLQKLSRALIQLAIAQAEADAQAQSTNRNREGTPLMEAPDGE
jgi:hypothetical protein